MLKQRTAGLAIVLLLYIVGCKSTQNLNQVTSEVQVEDTLQTDSLEQFIQNEIEAIDEVYYPYYEPENRTYRSSYKKEFKLKHTKLELRFDWQKQHVLGKATLTLSPWFYPNDVLVLDAKNFTINSIVLLDQKEEIPLKYEYDNEKITITLNRIYTRTEDIYLQIDYVGKPAERITGGSKAITSDQGLYFINHDGENKNKPRQIWTQGETEANSAWFPTIDAPNQRCTQEMYLTVNDTLTTLSNGLLIYSQDNGNGTKTDYWKMDKPHAPYLFMIAVGDFSIIKDKWNDMEVSYYVDPKFEPYARDIFGNTPEMIEHFSELLNYKFPWPKYAQVAVHDYVSGAMENTSASLFMEDVQVTRRELLDESWDDIIAHELFHQWFGDLVTCESWSNLTLNEAFASYSEFLWREHKQGKQEAQFHLYQELGNYLDESSEKNVELIRFYYDDKEDMFDNHSYAKGGLILHMLRSYFGDDAFFQGLNYYLTENKYSDVEAHHLRLAFEKVSGEDLNWFFNQWFFSAGHPILDVEYQHIDSLQQLYIKVSQKQDFQLYPVFQIPLTLQYKVGEKFIDQQVWINQPEQEFMFDETNEPSYLLPDPEGVLLAEINVNNDEYQQWEVFNDTRNIRHQMSVMEPIWEIENDSLSKVFIIQSLDHSFWAIKESSLIVIQDWSLEEIKNIESKLLTMLDDPSNAVKSEAINCIALINKQEHLPKIKELLYDSSYMVAGTALYAYLQTDASDKDEIVRQFEQEENVNLVLPVADYYSAKSDSVYLDWFKQKIERSDNEALFYLVRLFGMYLMNVPVEQQQQGVDTIYDIGMKSDKTYLRFASFQSLLLVNNNESVANKLQQLADNEKDEELKEYFLNSL